MKLISAPIATVSHAAFRTVIEKFGGCDEYFTEMINAASLVNGGQFEKYYINPAPVPEKIVWQLVGKDAHYMAEAAAIVAEIGGIGVDINMGCCAPEIVRAGAGIAWMSKPHTEVASMIKKVRHSLDAAEAYIAPTAQNVPSVKNVTKPRLSVKLRLGEENFSDKDFFDFCNLLCDNGVELLTLHARTKKEKYRTHSRWEYVARLAEKMESHVSNSSDKKVEVYLNGDVFDAASFAAAVKAAPKVSGIMIGRAAIQKPWIFAECAASINCATSLICTTSPTTYVETTDDMAESGNAQHDGKKTVVNLRETAHEFLNALEIYQPPEFWKTRCQRFFAYYCQNLSFAHYAQTQFANAFTDAKSLKELRTRIDDYFTKVPDDEVLSVCLCRDT